MSERQHCDQTNAAALRAVEAVVTVAEKQSTIARESLDMNARLLARVATLEAAMKQARGKLGAIEFGLAVTRIPSRVDFDALMALTQEAREALTAALAPESHQGHGERADRPESAEGGVITG